MLPCVSMRGNKSAETPREMRVRIRGRKTSVPPPPSDVPQVDRGPYNRNDEGDDSPNQDKQLTMRGGLYELPARYQPTAPVTIAARIEGKRRMGRTIIRRHFCNLFLALPRGKRLKGCTVLESLSLALELEPAEH